MNYWQGDRVRLRGVEPHDAPAFFEWNLDSDTGRNLDFLWPPISKALVTGQVEEMAKQTLTDDRFRWIIENREGVAVGGIDTHHCDRRVGVFSYGVHVAAEHRRKGYASEAICLVVSYYFDELRYQKLNVQIQSANSDSIALHERLGFQLEGRIRRGVYTQGRFFDLLWYGITDEEWRHRPSKVSAG